MVQTKYSVGLMYSIIYRHVKLIYLSTEISNLIIAKMILKRNKSTKKKATATRSSESREGHYDRERSLLFQYYS